MMRAPRTNGELDTTYRTPGKYVIVQIGSKGGTAAYACQVVEVLPNEKPTNYSWVSCSPGELTLTIRNDPAFKFDYYEVIWDAGEAGAVAQIFRPGETQTRSYPNSLPRQIRITGRYNGLTCSAFSDVQVSPSGPPATTPRITRLEVTDAATARLEFDALGAMVDIYKKEGATGTYTREVAGVNGPFRNLQNLDNAGKQYCFQVRNAGLGCGTQPLQSEELCTIPLTAIAQNQQNLVRWTAHPAPSRSGVTFGGYALTRNGTPRQQYPGIGSTTYTDTQVDCGFQYSYQVTATIRTGAGVMISVSPSVPVVAINNTPPPPITDVVANVTAPNQVELRWVVPPASAVSRLFTVSRAVNGSGDFVRVGDNTDPVFTDQVNASANSYCYRISYQDLCSNNATPSDPVCTVFLQRQGESLGWSVELPFIGGLGTLRDYTVELVNDDNSATSVSNAGSQTSFLLDLNSASAQQLRYRIRANSARGVQSFSNVVSLTLAMRLFVPDAFSPNGDGVNDAFSVQGVFIKTFKMTVFNRWGVPLFRTDAAAPGWDGTFNGQPADAGSYSYAIQAEDFRGETFVKRGSFLLLR